MHSILLALVLSLWARHSRKLAPESSSIRRMARLPRRPMADIGRRLGYTLDLVRDATAESLRGSRLVYFRAPTGTFTESEKAAIVARVKSRGSLLLVLDEEKH